MTVSTIALALVFCPILLSLPLNFVRFNWGFRRGMAPMPPDVEEKALEADRMGQVFDYLILLAFVFLLLLRVRIPIGDLGVSSRNWLSAAAIGLFVGASVIGVLNLLIRMTPEKASKEPESRGSVVTWCAIRGLGSFACEFWRVFCIIGLIRLDLPPWSAVLIAAAAWGSSQLIRNLPRFLGSAIFGVTAGFLFTGTGSFFAPLSLSLVAGGIHFYRVRHALGSHRNDASQFDVVCPVCKTVFDRRTRGKAKEFACPHCGEKLMYQIGGFGGVCALMSVIVAPVLLYFLGSRGVGLIVGSMVGIIVMFFLTAAVYSRLRPPELVRSSSELFFTNGAGDRKRGRP